MAVEVRNGSKSYFEGKFILRNFNMHVGRGEMLVIYTFMHINYGASVKNRIKCQGHLSVSQVNYSPSVSCARLVTNISHLKINAY